MDLYGALVLVDAIDDPVGPAPRGVIAVEGFIQWLARAVRVDSERTVDRLHGSGSDIEWQVLVEVAPGLPREDDGVLVSDSAPAACGSLVTMARGGVALARL